MIYSSFSTQTYQTSLRMTTYPILYEEQIVVFLKLMEQPKNHTYFCQYQMPNIIQQQH